MITTIDRAFLRDLFEDELAPTCDVERIVEVAGRVADEYLRIWRERYRRNQRHIDEDECDTFGENAVAIVLRELHPEADRPGMSTHHSKAWHLHLEGKNPAEHMTAFEMEQAGVEGREFAAVVNLEDYVSAFARNAAGEYAEMFENLRMPNQDFISMIAFETTMECLRRYRKDLVLS